MNDDTIKKALARFESRRVDEFIAYMNSPATKLLISMIPACQPPELVETLLRATYERGFEIGVSAVALPMLEARAQKDQ